MRQTAISARQAPQNPIKKYCAQSLIYFEGWLPFEWYHVPRLRQEWFLQEFGGAKRLLYEPVEI